MDCGKKWIENVDIGASCKPKCFSCVSTKSTKKLNIHNKRVLFTRDYWIRKQGVKGRSKRIKTDCEKSLPPVLDTHSFLSVYYERIFNKIHEYLCVCVCVVLFINSVFIHYNHHHHRTVIIIINTSDKYIQTVKNRR